MGCYLEEYRARVDTWATRFSWRTVVGHVGSKGRKTYAGIMILCAAVIRTSLIIGGEELIPGPVSNIVQVSCSGCNGTLKSGTQCDTCVRWYHNSCGNVKVQVVVSRR
jgi:hypothetical protein